MIWTPRLGFFSDPLRAAHGHSGPLFPAPRSRGARLDAPVARLGWGTLTAWTSAPWALRPQRCAWGTRSSPLRYGLLPLCRTVFHTPPDRASALRECEWEGPVQGHVFGCVCGSQLIPRPGREIRLHFLPFPQEGTHTPLNLTPKAAASRLGVSDRPDRLPLPHTRPWGPASGLGSVAAPSPTLLRDACPQGPRHPSHAPASYPAAGGLAPCGSPGP